MTGRRRTPTSLRARFAAFLVTALAGSASLDLPAQTAPTPTADQLQMLQNLTPEQRDAIQQQLGGGARTGGSGNGTATGTNGTGQTLRDRENRDPATVEKERRLEEARAKREHDELFPVLKPEDTVLITVDYAPPRNPFLNGLNGVPGAAPGQAGQPANGSQQGATAALGANSQPNGPVQTRPNQRSSQGVGEVLPPGEEPPLTENERRDLDKLIELLRASNPYRLDRAGAIQLPGFPPIPLAGLSEEQATLRLQAEPAFHRLEIKLTRLPLERTGFESLKPFGYDLFENAPTTFAPVTDVPVPADYVMGPGDVLEVQLFGNQNRTLRLTVGRDGRISFPELGPISVGGQLFDAVRSAIESRVTRQMIGVRASVSMGETRSIRVFVLGEAKYPGSYTVSGLSSMTAALFASGGIKPIGSLRDIQLKRQGTVVRRLDLYDLLIRGDTRDDARLLPGDVIFVPPVGPTASVDGEVRRPAIYELKGDARVSDLIELSGGLAPDADSGKAALSRVDDARRRVVVDVDLSSSAGRSEPVRNGDALRVNRLRPQLDSGVQLVGHVYRPAVFAWHEGLRLTDVIGSVDEIKPNGDFGYILIRREVPPDRRIVALSADLNAALREPNSNANVALMPRDRITVFDLASGREHILAPLINELRVQGGFERPTDIVRVEGRVKVPGDYPLEQHMRVSDLIRAGGSLSDAAYGGSAELTRYVVVNGESRETDHIPIDLAAVRRGDERANLELRPFDYLAIKEVPAWGKLEQVTLRGEVRFPGVYPIRRGETMRTLLDRAGGLTDLAFPRGAVFTRTDLRKQEQEQLDTLQERLQRDIATLALQGAASANAAQAGSAVQVGQALLGQLQSTKAVGRLVIDLRRLYASRAGSSADIALHDGDELIVPRLRQEVTVIGEVQTTTSHLYREGLSRDAYIAQSGGFTHRADKGRIYVVHADGSVVANSGNRWFNYNSKVAIETGDTIVVPMDVEHLPPLPLWQAVTTIIYNIAVSVAAVHAI